MMCGECKQWTQREREGKQCPRGVPPSLSSKHSMRCIWVSNKILHLDDVFWECLDTAEPEQERLCVLLFTLSDAVRVSAYLGWWSAHTNTNITPPPPPRPLIGQSPASRALIGPAAATFWSSIIERREEKLSSLTLETVNNICYFWNQLIASLQSILTVAGLF